MQSERESIKRLIDPNSKVSCHILINQKGEVFKMVEHERIAWHAGKSIWGEYKNLNYNSIGIELVNKGHKYGYENFKKKQIKVLIKICKYLIKKYKIKSKNIVGHSDIAPLRKIDPGEKFPWKNLSKHKIGIWHSCNSKKIKKLRKNKKISFEKKIEFFKNLKKIGYFISLKKKGYLLKTIKAFQRHHRQELVNGILDLECLEISRNLGKKC